MNLFGWGVHGCCMLGHAALVHAALVHAKMPHDMTLPPIATGLVSKEWAELVSRFDSQRCSKQDDSWDGHVGCRRNPNRSLIINQCLMLC
ncbi:hypothetical protein V8C86DRAFT_2646273 [Haematococcus lacustris]